MQLKEVSSRIYTYSTHAVNYNLKQAKVSYKKVLKIMNL